MTHVGGVDFNVPPGMNYDDPTQDLHIHIPEGQQKLNGEQFVQLMRFRSGYAGGDIPRIVMQVCSASSMTITPFGSRTRSRASAI